jgi:hypothetical protein
MAAIAEIYPLQMLLLTVSGRWVALGRFLPRAPTDPDVRD